MGRGKDGKSFNVFPWPILGSFFSQQNPRWESLSSSARLSPQSVGWELGQELPAHLGISGGDSWDFARVRGAEAGKEQHSRLSEKLRANIAAAW